MPSPKQNRKAHTSGQDLVSSNSTTARFVGNATKSWMSGDLTSSNNKSGAPQISPLTPQAAPLNQKSGNGPPTHLHVQTAGDTDGNNAMPPPLFSPSFDRGRFPAERRKTRANKGLPRKSSNKGPLSDTTNLTSTFIRAISGQKVRDSSVTASLPSPAPSYEQSIEGENSATIAGPAPLDPTLSQDQPLEGFDGADCIGDQFQAYPDRFITTSTASIAASSASAVAQGDIAASTMPGFTAVSSPKPGARHNTLTDKSRNLSSEKRAGETATGPRTRPILPQPGQPPDEARATAPSNHPSPQVPSHDFQKYSQIVAERLRAVSGLIGRGSIEGSRLGLLQDACTARDYFYLLLHQFLCRKSMQGNQASYPRDIEVGFGFLSEILAPNNNLTMDAIEWFSKFPTLLPSNTTRPMQDQQTEWKVLNFLRTFANGWTSMRQQHPKQSLPPSSNDILLKTGLDSVVLQQVVFRAILRSSWVEPFDSCFRRCEMAFSRDQDLVHSQLWSIPAGESSPQIRLRLSAWAKEEYGRILSAHYEGTCSNDSHVDVNAAINPPVSMVPLPARQDSSSSGGTRRHGGNDAIPANVRPESLNLDIRAAQQPYIASLQRNTHLSSPPVTGTHSAFFTGMHRTSHESQSSSPLLPNTASGFTMSRPGSGHQSPALPGQPQYTGTPVLARSLSSDQQHHQHRPNSANSFMPRSLHQTNAATAFSGAPVPSSVMASSGPTMSLHRAPPWPGQQSHPQQFLPPSALPIYQHGAAARGTALSPANAQWMNNNQAAFNVQPNQQPQPYLGPVPRQLLNGDRFVSLPPPNSFASLPRIPTPVATALHQSYAKSPQPSFVNPEVPQEHIKSFRFVRTAFVRQALSSSSHSFDWIKIIDNKDAEKFAKDAIGPLGLPYRTVTNGSYLCRIRCIKLPGPLTISESNWILADTCWPSNVVVNLNGRSLEIRRKSHYGKDLPIDVTSFVKGGENRITAAVLGFPADRTEHYLVGLEILQINDVPHIKAQIVVLKLQDCRERILERFCSTDPDIEVVQPTIVLDMTDPFTSRIFDTPVRGKKCTHTQCFDLDTFLQSRGSPDSGEPCHAEQFKCPICKGDVRPHMMGVDSFLAKIRADLAEMGRLDAKAVMLKEDGSFEIKEEEKEAESGDGSRKRSSAEIGIEGAGGTPVGSSSEEKKANTPIETINLTDD